MVDLYNILEFAPVNLQLYSKKMGYVYFLQTYNSENKRKICCTKNGITVNFNEDGTINDSDKNIDLQCVQNSSIWNNYQKNLFTQRQSIGYIITNKGKNEGTDEHSFIIMTNGNKGLLDINGCNIDINDIPALHTYHYANTDETIEFYINFKPLVSKNNSPHYKAGSYIIAKNNIMNKTVYKIIRQDVPNHRYIVTDIFSPNSELYIYYEMQYVYESIRKNDPLIKKLEEQQRMKKEEKQHTIEIYNFKRDTNKKANEFKPGDEVLCRDINSFSAENNWSCYWCLCKFSHVYTSKYGQVQYIASGRPWDFCIPYNKYTEELIGTKNDYITK